jgi:hypothetical protein
MKPLLKAQSANDHSIIGKDVTVFDRTIRPFGFAFRKQIPSWDNDAFMNGGIPTGTPGGATSVTVPLDSDPAPPDTDDMAA